MDYQNFKSKIVNGLKKSVTGPAEFLFYRLPVVSGIVREQAATFGNIIGRSIYDQISGYSDELEYEEHMCCCHQDFSQFEKSHTGSAIGAVFDLATLTLALAKPSSIPYEFIDFSSSFWLLKAQTNTLSLATLFTLIGASKVDSDLERLAKQAHQIR